MTFHNNYGNIFVNKYILSKSHLTIIVEIADTADIMINAYKH